MPYRYFAFGFCDGDQSACGAKRPGRVSGARRRPEVPRCPILDEQERYPPSLKVAVYKSVSGTKSRGQCERRGHRGSADPRGHALWPSQLAAGEIGTRCRPLCVYLCTFDSCWRPSTWPLEHVWRNLQIGLDKRYLTSTFILVFCILSPLNKQTMLM